MKKATEEKAMQIKTVTRRVTVRLGDLRVDHRYQGQLHSRRVARLLREWKDSLGIELFVSIRADGSIWILDGQHRHAVMMELGWGDFTIEVNAYEGLSLMEEAHLHRLFNNTRSRTAFEDFQDDVVARIHPALEINRIAEECGWKVAAASGPKHVCCVATLRLIFKTFGSETLRNALSAVGRAWNYQEYSAEAAVLLGVAAASAVDKAVPIDKLISRLKRETPEDLGKTIRAEKRARRVSLSEAAANTILRILKERVHR